MAKIMRMNQARKLSKNEIWKEFAKRGWIDGVNRIPDHTAIDNVHKNKPCAVIGSGFTARGIDYSLLKNVVTIAINHVIEVYPQADYLIFQDHRFLRLNKFNLGEYKGTVVVANSNPIVAKKPVGNLIAFMPLALKQKPSNSIKDGLYARKSTGLCALNLAIVLGCNPIYILGCDMPRNWRDTVNLNDGVHINKDYRGSVDTMLALEQYESTLDLYEPFGKYAKRIINVCENGIIKYFRQINMKMFNEKLKEIK